MKKIISLILATLMCATMAPAVFADDAAVETAAVEATAETTAEAEEETATDLEWVSKDVVITAEHLVAISGASAEEVAALVGESEITAELAIEVLTALECPMTAEELTAAVIEVAAPIEKYEVTYMSANFAMYLIQAMGAYVADEEAAEVYALLQIVEEAGLLTPAFMAETLTTSGLETTEADVYTVIAKIIEYVSDTTEEAVEETEAVEEAVTEEAVEETAEVEEVEEAVEEEVIEVTEEVVEEVVSKYPVILEEIPTFGLFTRILSVYTFRG